MDIIKTEIFNGTWLGKKGTSTTHHLDHSPTGLRIHVFQLEGVSATKIALIEGDGRTVAFKTYSEYTRHNPSKVTLQVTVDSLVKYAETLNKSIDNTEQSMVY